MGDPVSFTVPSGNFGNVLAGHIARQMGLPIHRLVVATNENDVLDEFFRTGVYRPRTSAQTHETSSPSMDISKASNFERFVYDLVGRDAKQTAALWQSLAGRGQFDLSGLPAFQAVESRFGFQSGVSSHADRLRTIALAYERYNTLIDTHTADGLKVALERRQSDVPMVVLETALPIKFASTIIEAIGVEPPRRPEHQNIEQLPQRVQVLPSTVDQVKDYITQHA
jgi:threonine synthase